jgi:hypothetical protein
MSQAALLMTLAAILQAGGTPDSKKAPFTSKQGGFSIAMPGEPNESFQTQQMPEGTLVNKIYQFAGGEGVYSVICSDFPSFLNPSESEPVLDGVLNGYTQALGGKVSLQKKIQFDGVNAREAKLVLDSGTMYARYFIKRKRIYQILMFKTEPKAGDDAEFQKYAASFRSAEPVGKLTDGMEALTTWKPFRSKGGGFTVQLLGDPKETSQMLETATGQVEMIQVNCSKASGECFIVAYSPVAKSDPPLTPQAFYKAAVDGAAANIKGTIVSQRSIQFDGRPGVEAEISLPGDKPFADGVCLLRLQRVGDRLYQLIYVGMRSEIKGKDVTNFHESFHLEGQKIKFAPTPGKTATPKK